MLEALGHYRILDKVGTGRMGDLYRARDTRAGRTVAIRVVATDIADDSARRKSYLIDALATKALSHPNIAALYEIGDDNGRLFLVSEHVPGGTLKAVIAGSALNARHALDHGIQLADALAEAHAEGIVHRDIRPGNIIITPKGHAKFLDFGLAAWTGGGAERGRAPGALAAAMGLPHEVVAYMSPEQVLGEQVDYRTDIFSLGVVLFEMLAGRPPFAGVTVNAMTVQILHAQPQAPSALNRTLPAELDAIVMKMLAKSQDHRYGAAAAVAAELRAVAAILDVRDGVVEPPDLAPDTSRTQRAPLFWIALMAASIIVLLFLLTTDAGARWWSSLTRTLRHPFGLLWHSW